MTKSKLLTIGLYADLHLTNSNRHYKVGTDGKSDLLERAERFIEHIAQRECDIYVNLGDTTDENIVDTYVLPALNMSLLGPIAQKGKPYLNLEGNHCIVDGANVYSILSSYKEQVSSHVQLTIQEPTDTIFEVAGKSIYVRSVPYIGDYIKMREMIVKPLDEAYNHFSILLFHAPCNNALMDNGLPSTHGLHLEENDLDQYDIAIGGDFHRPQMFKVGDTPVYYCGAPFALTRGQNFPLGSRELSIYDDGSYEMSSIPNPYALNICDLGWTETDKLDKLDPARTILYVNDVPHEEKSKLVSKLNELNFYSYKVKMASIQKSTVLEEDKRERIESHKRQDIRSLLHSVLSKEESDDPWIIELLERVAK